MEKKNYKVNVGIDPKYDNCFAKNTKLTTLYVEERKQYN